MSSEAQNLMIEVIDAHTYNGADRGFLGEHRVEYCICGWSEEGDGVHTAHVASEVDKALGGLRRETRVIESIFELGVPETATRFVTHWTEIPHE
ncbi:hypothetical protein PBI_STROKESEAT_80 [Mycobacterium phage Strokeseat]|uniref:Uncharacterized protein n=2 Tax=Cheoctovirus TaxID=1623281 RepID=A0A7G9V024_9CAUD|nr:hypothetical protein FDI13_gp089 [Mycobacterium phage Spartacus]YP_009958215.1 hypothetical protein I5H48_gp080 [Mycobacterium phage Hlubikazi]QGJ91159.1 hypothetical protein PBI_STROKESEAT_80 [Mycobacterium phage Strokeseat]QNN99076.1 hypothetical protein PBI_MANDLOVU_80 [Mycobacterium phage Mandlovu]AFA45097.1 hypothetical protein SPARTACUS_89 [Mycobacterium phage Spartacus]QNN99629.1 hypothetical protein PBI_HLUBIKAZI_80 [Mycobacterium phage Hlubikazi]